MPNPFWCSYTILLSRATLFSLVFNNSKTPSTHCYYIARLAEWRSRSDTSKAFHVSSSQWACGSDSKSPRGLGQQMPRGFKKPFFLLFFFGIRARIHEMLYKSSRQGFQHCPLRVLGFSSSAYMTGTVITFQASQSYYQGYISAHTVDKN